MESGPRPRRRPSRWSWSRFTTGAVAATIAIGILIIVVAHKDSQFPQASDCPASSRVNAALDTHVARPTAASDDELLGCFYHQGSDSQAVAVSFAVRTLSVDPCRRRPRMAVAGYEACNVSGTSGTAKTGLSLVVETAKLQYQFSTDLRQVTLSHLEDLAVTIVAEPPPPVQRSSQDPN